MNDDRLQDAVLADVLDEFVELGIGNFGAWVVRILVQARHRQQQGLPAVTVVAIGGAETSATSTASSRSS